MSSELADKLMQARSTEAFLREQNVALRWQVVAALKGEVDRLVRCDLKAAARLSERVGEVATLAGDPISKAFAEASRARVLHLSGRPEEANALFGSAVDAMRSASLKSEAAEVQMQQVAALRQMGRYGDALKTASAARRVLKRGSSIQLAQLETNVGTIYYRLDRYKEALSHYDRAREILSVAGDDSMRALVDLNRAHVFTEIDRPDEALGLLESSAAAYERAGHDLFAAQARFHIAYIQFHRGNYNTALTTYYQTRDRLTELGSPQLVAWCNQEIAEILLELNAFDEAAENAATARASFSELNMPYEAAQASLVGALATMGQGQFEQAQSGLEEARRTFARHQNKSLIALVDAYLAELAIRRSDYREASERSASAFRVFARQKLVTRAAYSRMLSARAAYHLGDQAKAYRASRAALTSLETYFAPAVAYQCHHLIGCIERDRKRSRLALASFRRAVETIESMRGGIAADEFKATFLRDKIAAYEDAIAACLSDGSEALVEEAFRLVESSKSRALADLLARYVRDTGQQQQSGLHQENRARLAKLIEDLNWYSSQAGIEEDKGEQRSADVADRYRRSVMRCERQIAQLFRRVEVEDRSFADIQCMRAASTEDLRDTLEAGETAIEFFTTGDQVSAFVATRDSIKVARQIASKSGVRRALAGLRFQLEKFNFGRSYVDAHFSQLKRAADDYLSDLYRMIFAPLEQMLSSERLIVIPHGELHYVPFPALRDGLYLVDRFEISYAPSAAVLKLCRDMQSEISDTKSQTPDGSRRKGDKLVALGLADRETPHIADEINALGSLFPGAIKLTAQAATRENLMRVAPQARFLHLASHGYFRRDNPMFSFLKLADSHLNFYNLLDLKLSAELVTLSACHTGVNMVFPGDELHGLMRGFLYAGAPSLVASLWAVSDRSTAELMREMYTHIRAGETKRAALRRAQLAIKDDYGHPYYWAPFVLMGNPV